MTGRNDTEPMTEGKIASMPSKELLGDFPFFLFCVQISSASKHAQYLRSTVRRQLLQSYKTLSARLRIQLRGKVCTSAFRMRQDARPRRKLVEFNSLP